MKAFAAQGPDGLACFDEVLDAVEHRIPAIRARQRMGHRQHRGIAKPAGSQLPGNLQVGNHRHRFAKSLGIDDLPARIENTWLDVVDAALAANTQTFAVLPMHDLLDPHGYLVALQARGYVVTPPDAVADSSPAAPVRAIPVAAASVSY